MVIKIFHYLKNNRVKAVIVYILWTALIFYLCLKAGNSLPKISIPNLDKVAHIIFFGIHSFLFLCVRSKATIKNFIISFLVSLGIGIFIEIIQGSSLILNRSFEFLDIIADGFGALLGVFCFIYLNKFRL